MYKIYFKEKVLILTSTAKIPELKPYPEATLVARYDGRRKSIFHFIDSLEKPTPYQQVILYHDNYTKLKKDVKGIFNTIHAGGGVVLNKSCDMLLIHRRGRWDLPKGKCDFGEKKRETAKREIKEETGAKGVKVYHKIGKTRHSYRHNKDGRVLKITHWYLMSARDGELTPETREGIDQAIWVPSEEVDSYIRHSYRAIKAVFDLFKADEEIDARVRELF